MRAVVNAVTGMVRERRDYTAWGEVELEQGTPQALGYAGGLTDPSTRLIRFGARDHDPSAGRWTAKDPIGFNARRTNLYAYASNDPVNLVDPSGLAEGTQDECLEWLQGALDVIGTADPTGMADLANAALYAGQGKLADAGVSALGMVPFLGVTATLGRVAARGATAVSHGLGRAAKRGPPNSIYEQLDQAGKVRSRTFYDDNGHPFSRQDFNRPHGGLQSHEHNRTFDSQGQPMTSERTGPIPPGYDNTPTLP